MADQRAGSGSGEMPAEAIKKSDGFLKKLFKVAVSIKKKEKEELKEKEQIKKELPVKKAADRERAENDTGRSATSSRNESVENEEEDVKPIKINIPVREILFVIIASAILSPAFFFIFDVAGMRTGLRDKLTDILIGTEKEMLEQKLRTEYEELLTEEKAGLLRAERENLVTEYAALEKARSELEKEKKQLESREAELETKTADFDQKEKTLAEQIIWFEEAKLEISELAKIYENMEAKNAARIFTAMTDESLMLKIMKAMKKDKLSAVFELMESVKAADIISKLD